VFARQGVVKTASGNAVARFGCTDMLVQNRAGYRPVVFLRELVAEGSTIYACEVAAYRKQP
jgi:hypothetical protein